MDGSAKDFFDKLKDTKIKTLNSKRKYLKISDNFQFSDGEKKDKYRTQKFFRSRFSTQI